MARLRVGLTGGIASGKSTLAEALSKRGAVVIDSDALARDVVAPDTPGLDEVVRRFGTQVLDGAGALDRAALGQLVFADAVARRDLEAIIHPRVRARAAQLETEAAAPVVVQMIPLLVETGQTDSFDIVVVIDLPVWLQRHRLQLRSGLPAAELDRRLAAQASRGERLRAADLVVDNSGDLSQLDDLAGQLWTVLDRRASVPFTV